MLPEPERGSMTRPAPNDRDAIDAAVAAALAETGVHHTFARTVRELLERHDEQWRVCCGSGCDPCVEALGRAVDAARRRLGPGPSSRAPAEG